MKNKTPILNEKQFEDLIRERSGNPEFTLSVRKKLLASTKPAEDQQIRKSIDQGAEEVGTEMWTDLYRPT
jgi:hypothetical protein